MANDLVSVVIPTYNAVSTIVSAVTSVTAQTYGSIEVLLCDDGSSDNTVSVLEALSEQDHRIRVLTSERNEGAAASRNQGLRAARGRFVAFLDADDQWLPNKLEQQLELMRRTSAAVSHTAYLRVTSRDDPGKLVPAVEFVDYRKLLRTNAIGMSTAVVDRNRTGDIEIPDLRKRQDYALWLSLAKDGYYSRGLNVPLTRYLVHSGSLSSDMISSLSYTWRVYREIAGLHVIRRVWFMGLNIFNAIRKRT